MKTPLVARLVALCCRFAPVVVVAGLLLAVASGWYAAHHFAMTADTDALISAKLKWRRDSAALDAAFPQNSDVTAVVVDGRTPELAEAAADRLSAALASNPEVLNVRRPTGGPFFEKEALLLLPLKEVQSTVNQLLQAQGFFGPLAADPSLRGVMSALDTAAEGVAHGQASFAQLDRPMVGLTAALGAVADGRPAYFSWQALFNNGPHTAGTRQFILVKPKLDYSSLQPGEDASAAIRATARKLGLDAAHGVTVRLTGSVPLNDEQFSSLKARAGLISGFMLGAMVLMLWLGTRSWKLILAIMATAVVGLVITAGVGLLAVGRFNLISVAFIPLFVGLGVDFGIQLSVRFQAERGRHPDLKDALATAGGGVGGSLALAAAAVALAFFAFLPTEYVGVSELGVIAGFGMIIAFGLAISFLPALLVLLKPTGAPGEEVGLARLGPLDDYLVERRGRVLKIAAGIAVVCLVLATFTRFDFNPLHLQNPHGEAISTVYDLMKDPQETPNTIDILTPSLADADRLAARFDKLKAVSQVLTLSTFIPDDQTAKLVAISDAELLLDPTLNPFDVQPAPSDAEVAASLAKTAADLKSAAGANPGAPADHARALANVLARLASGPPAHRQAATQALIPPLDTLLAQLRLLLQAQPVTRASLPADLVRDWIAPDGRARVSVFPSGDSNSNAVLKRFSTAVRAIAPDATGTPITIQEAGRTIYTAFIQAGVLSFIVIVALLLVVLRSLRDVALTLAPIFLTGLLTLATCVVIGQPLNFANIIAFPLLLGIGVAFNIYFVIAWRNGETNLLRSSLARAVLFSALTTGASFGALVISPHPGTSGIGELLLIALGWTLVTALLFEPALLGPPPPAKRAIS